MPGGAQYSAAVIPLTYYLKVVRGIVLKGVAVLRFRKQLD